MIRSKDTGHRSALYVLIREIDRLLTRDPGGVTSCMAETLLFALRPEDIVT